MKFIDYLKSLLPTFSKNRVVDDARVTYAGLESEVIPSYENAEKVFYNWKLRSSKMKDFTTVFNRIMKTDTNQGIVLHIGRALRKILESKDFVQDKIDSSFETEIVVDGLSSLKANLLRIVETVRFVSDYSMLFLNYVYILETAEQSEDSNYVKSTLSPGEIEYLEKNFSNFCFGLLALAKDKNKFSKIIDEIPDVLVNINTGETVIKTIGEDKLDPLNMRNFSGNTNNPIYHIRLIWANHQMEVYRRNKELKKVLELRLLNLTMVSENTPDAKLQKEIDYTQNRVQKLDYEIRKMEEGV